MSSVQSLCFKREAAEDIRKIDEQPDVSDISSDVVKRNNFSAIWCSVTFKSPITTFKGAVLGNNLTKISWHKTNGSLKEHLFGFKEGSLISTILTLWLNFTKSER